MAWVAVGERASLVRGDGDDDLVPGVPDGHGVRCAAGRAVAAVRPPGGPQGLLAVQLEI